MERPALKHAGSRLRPRRDARPQRGQAAVEFVFSLVLLLAFVAVMFQALHFELDVFNKSALLRYRTLHAAREDQETTDPTWISDITVEGKSLRDLTFFTVPLQEIDLEQHYGPKRLVMRKGTKYWDPLPALHSTGSFFLLLGPDHYEPTSGYVGDAFGVLSDAVDSIE